MESAISYGSGTRPLNQAGTAVRWERGGILAYQVRSPISTDEQDSFLDWYAIRGSCTVGTMSKAYRWPWDSSKSYRYGLLDYSP